jgi:hypothetical protein
MRSQSCFWWLVLAMLLAILGTTAMAAKPQEYWNKTFGGPYSDGAWSMQGTRDGGYIIAGYTSSQGQSSDLWIVKIDSDGKKQWEKTIGGSGEDVGYSIRQTRDDGYVVAGSTKSYGMGDENLWLLKCDANGTRQWDRTFGGFVYSSGDGAWSVDESRDGGYIVTGYTRSFGAGAKDLWLLKTDTKGKKLWEKMLGGSKDDVGMSVVQTKDGGYIVTGRTASYGAGNDDIWLIKTDSTGFLQWNRTFGGSKDDAGLQVLADNDSYIIAGRTESQGSGKKAFLLKTDLNGKKLWENEYGENSTGISVQQISNGSLILAGHIESEDSGRDAWLVKTSSSGIMQWNMRLGGLGQDMATSIVESNGGGYVIAGITSSYGAGAEDVWLVKVVEENIDKVSDRITGNEMKQGEVSAGSNVTSEKSRPPTSGSILK